MNLVLAETVNDKNGSRRRITTLPDSFDMSVTFDQEGTCLLNFLSLDGSLIMSTAIETDKDMKEIILHTDKKSLKRIARNLLASINYDILYFITNDSYEDDDLDELPNQIIYADGIKAMNLNYTKSEWQTDFEFECISNISVFREVMQNSYLEKPSSESTKSNNPNKKKS